LPSCYGSPTSVLIFGGADGARATKNHYLCTTTLDINGD
jgi:hypothetical protein